MESIDNRRGKIILLPHSFLRTPKLIQKAKFPDEPNIVGSLSKRELIESTTEASLTRATYRDFRCRRRIAWFNDRVHLSSKSKNKDNDPLSHISIHILHTKTSSFWEITPTCKVWIQNLMTNHEWCVVKTVNEVRDLAKSIQAIEDAAIDDENAELALHAAVSAAMLRNDDDEDDSYSDSRSEGSYDQSNFYDQRKEKEEEEDSGKSDGYNSENEFDASRLRKGDSRSSTARDEANWKLDDEEEEEGEDQRKGALFEYLLSHGGVNTKHLINKKMPSLMKRDKLSKKNAQLEMEEDSEKEDEEDDEVDDKSNNDMKNLHDIEELDNLCYEDVSIVGDINQPATISSGGGISSAHNSSRNSSSSLSSAITSTSSNAQGLTSSTINAMTGGVKNVDQTVLWESLQTDNSAKNENIFKFLRNVIQLSSLFDPSAKEITNKDEEDRAASLLLEDNSPSRIRKKKHMAPQKKVLTHEEYQRIRRVRARRAKVGRAAGVLLAKWLSPPSSSTNSSTSFSTTSPSSATDASSLANEMLSSSSSIAAAVMRRTSFTTQATAPQPKEDDVQSSTDVYKDSSQTSDVKIEFHSRNKLIAEVRAYTMGVLSLPPLARLLAGYIDMMITELDDVYAESSLSAVVSNVSDPSNSVQVGVSSSVRTVGKLFSSLFTSVYTPDETNPPPPLPPPSPPLPHSIEDELGMGINDESLSEHIMNYWNDDDLKSKKRLSELHSSNTNQGNASSSLKEGKQKLSVSDRNENDEKKYAVVKRKAKVRQGVEFEKVSLPGGSESKAAEKVGTLSEGAVVVILDSAVATDGTRRSKVRGSHRNKEVVGWVTTKLLKPYPGPAKSRDSSTGNTGNAPALLTVPESSARVNSSKGVSRGNSDQKQDENTDFDCGDGPVHKVMDKLTDFMAQTTYLIKEACEEDLLLIVSLHAEGPMSMEEAEGIIDGGVWRQVEAEVYMPLQAKLISSLSKHVQLEASRFAQRLRSLKALPQTFWSISDKMISKASWNRSICLLNKIQFVSLPTDKVDLLLEAVRAIEEEHKAVDRQEKMMHATQQRIESINKEEAPLGADDIFPVFVYVLVQSDLWKGGEIIMLRDLLSSLANPERQRWSASAYYVATLEAAIEHIKAT